MRHISLSNIVLAITAILGPVGTATADHPTVNFGGEAAGPITTVSATTLASGQLAVGVRGEAIVPDRFEDNELVGFAASGQEGVHSLDRLTSGSFGAAYGITNDLTVSLRLPYIWRNGIRESEIEDGEAEAHLHGNSRGLGDLTAMAQYRPITKAAHGIDVGLLVGLKMPTGETKDRDKDGVRFEAEFQPGSGSWDPMAGLAATKHLGPVALDANVLYLLVNEGSQSTDLGDSFTYNVALSYRVFGSRPEEHDHAAEDADRAHEHPSDQGQMALDLILELNGEWRQKVETNGVSDPHSGGNLVFLSPGVRLVAPQGWSAFVSVGVPVIENLNGIQTDTDFRVVAGLGVAF